jgi:hypothetical protein
MATVELFKFFVIDSLDFAVAGIFFLIVLILGRRIANTKFGNSKMANYFYYGLVLKVFASIFYGIYHQFIYGGGDTLYYFQNAKLITNYLNDDFLEIPKYVFSEQETIIQELRGRVDFTDDLFLRNTALYVPIRFVLLLKYFGFNTYLGTEVIFGVLSFLALWYAYKVVIKLFPGYDYVLALCFVFFPSVTFWGSGVSKDTICISCICLVIIGIYNLFIAKRKLIISLLVLILAVYVVAVVKTYIAVALVPPLFIWIGLTLRKNITNNIVKRLIMPVILIATIGGGAFLSQNLAQLDARFQTSEDNKESLVQKAKSQQNILQTAGSAYSLGTDSDNFLVIAPFAIVVTLFRPFLWEIRNPFMLLSAIESLIILVMFWAVFVRWGFKKAVNSIVSNEYMLFSLMFTLFFSVGVGSSSGNFGTLVRYKIPCLPFISSTLVILYLQHLRDMAPNLPWELKFLKSIGVIKKPIHLLK